VAHGSGNDAGDCVGGGDTGAGADSVAWLKIVNAEGWTLPYVEMVLTLGISGNFRRAGRIPGLICPRLARPFPSGQIRVHMFC